MRHRDALHEVFRAKWEFREMKKAFKKAQNDLKEAEDKLTKAEKYMEKVNAALTNKSTQEIALELDEFHQQGKNH